MIQNKHPSNEKLMTVQEVCEWLTISRWSLYQMVSRGQIPHVKLGRRLRFVYSELDLWVQRNKKEENHNFIRRN